MPADWQKSVQPTGVRGEDLLEWACGWTISGGNTELIPSAYTNYIKGAVHWLPNVIPPLAEGLQNQFDYNTSFNANCPATIVKTSMDLTKVRVTRTSREIELTGITKDRTNSAGLTEYEHAVFLPPAAVLRCRQEEGRDFLKVKGPVSERLERFIAAAEKVGIHLAAGGAERSRSRRHERPWRA